MGPTPWALLIALLLAASSWRHVSAQKSYSLLAGERAKVTFIPFTLDQKQLVFQQASNIFGIWANYRFKLSYYNDDRVDPFPRLAAMEPQIKGMTTAEFHYNLSSIFTSVRDGHTNYRFPGPHSCYRATFGIGFTFADSTADIATNPKVVVQSFSTIPQLQALIGAQLSSISIGDELLAIDGISFLEYVEANVYESEGSNTFGGMRNVLFNYLTTRYGSINRMPEKDNITLTFRSVATQQMFNATVSYVAQRDEACWNVSSALYQNITTVLPGGGDSRASSSAKRLMDYTPTRVLPRSDPRKTPLGSRVLDQLDFELEQQTAATPGAPLFYINTVPMYGTQVSSVYWGIFQPGGKNLGVIRLTDFEPIDSSGNYNVDLGVTVIRGLLVNELKDTNAVVIDLRSNAGGFPDFANSVPQLFKPDFVEPGYEYIHNDLGKHVFVDTSGPGDSFYDAFASSAPHAYFTNLGYIGTFDSDNTYGQAYLKPMGLLTDASCFSACDLLSIDIANSGTGVVFGEDGQTGGGGAEVFTIYDLNNYDPADFHPLPFASQLETFGLYMRVGIRAVIENGGPRNGSQLEDYGAPSDYVFRPLISDLLPSATTSSQFARIADVLFRSGMAAGTNGRYFVSEPQAFTLRQVRVFAFTAQVANLTNLFVFSTAGALLGQNWFKKSSQKKRVTCAVKTPSSGLGNSAIIVKSFALVRTSSKQILKTRRIISILPHVAKYFNLERTIFLWDLKLKPYVGVYNEGASLANPTLGWVLGNGKWQVGDGVQYANNVNTSLQFFFQAAVGTSITVSLKASYDTEQDNDYFYVNYLYDNNAIPLLTSTGAGTLNTSVSILTKAAHFSISLQFVSDPGVQFSGVSLFSFSVM